MADHAFYIGLFFIVALTIITWEVLRSRFVAKLRSRVHDVWASVGSPGGIWRRLVLIDGFQLEGFILRRGYQSLPADLVADGDKLNVTLKVVLVVALVAVLAIVGPFLVGR